MRRQYERADNRINGASRYLGMTQHGAPRHHSAAGNLINSSVQLSVGLFLIRGFFIFHNGRDTEHLDFPRVTLFNVERGPTNMKW